MKRSISTRLKAPKRYPYWSRRRFVNGTTIIAAASALIRSAIPRLSQNGRFAI